MLIFLGCETPHMPTAIYGDVDPAQKGLQKLAREAADLGHISLSGYDGNGDLDESVQADNETLAGRLSSVRAPVAQTHLTRNTVIFDTHEDYAGALIELRNSVLPMWFGETAPVWVEGNDPTFVALLAQQYGCPVGRPDDWEDG